ncbi:MAG: ABC transporter ATP-binding protein [Acidobacteria bacterium]|nr:MAG: ABC transporter ATP-binding protein [Acidobacteriota bacterium]
MIRCEGVSVELGGQPIVRDVSLTIPSGGLVGVLGPNGSGKTTLFRAISGAIRPRHGSIFIDDANVSTLSSIQMARRLAVVPQETQLALDYSVLELVLMGRYPHLGPFEVEGPRDLASAHAALNATGTDHLAERAFNTLSGGEKQRVVIASALAQLGEGTSDAGAKGRVLLLDEPTASLDLKYQLEVAMLLRRLHDRQDITIVLSTHDIQFAARLCSELVLLGGGRVLAQGSPAAVLTQSQISALYGIDPAQAAPFALRGTGHSSR